MVVETDSSGKLLVHRDVFATTKDKVVQGGANTTGSGKLGEVFGLHGGYDLFPETTGSYEVKICVHISSFRCVFLALFFPLL